MSEFVRASTAYRETILEFVRRAVLQQTAPARIRPLHGQPVEATDTVEIGGRTFSVTTRRQHGILDFVKLRPCERDVWGAYWVRGKGMKVFGPYDEFERDILLLKTFTS